MNIINLVTNKNISKKEIIERLNKQIADFFKGVLCLYMLTLFK